MKKLVYALAILCLPSFVYAQEVIISGEALYNTNFSIINSQIVKPTGKSTNKAGKATVSDLKFVRSQTLSKTIQNDFINQLAKGNPGLKPKIVTDFASNKIRNQFDQLLTSYGFSSLDIADAMTAYLVINWQVVNGKELGDKNGFEAVRKNIRATLLKNGKLKTATAVDKQKLAENFGYQSIIAMSTYRVLVNKNDRVGLNKLQQTVYQNTKQAGLDLKSYTLTNRGFVKN